MGIALIAGGGLVPLWVKVVYTLFLFVLVPYYWRVYGPTNFLYFCDLALFVTLAALWLESPLLASTAAVGILLPQLLWMADFLVGFVGLQITGMTAYMFRSDLSLLLRGLSLFHFWLPPFLLWLLAVLGYDPRAWLVATSGAWVVLPICYFFLPAPPAPPKKPNLPVNVNHVYGLSDLRPQKWMSPHLYFLLLMAFLPLALYLPTHFLLWAVYPVAG
jgi:hypothetical protein